MQVLINNRRVNLGERDVLGSGGEAVVFKHKNWAVKIYHDPTPARAAKLLGLLQFSASLPAEVIAPRQPVFDLTGQQIVGFTMETVPPQMLPLSNLRNRALRANYGFNNRQVAELFLAIHPLLTRLHAAGLVIGDFNELNLLFEAARPVFIDVDSYQFGPYACPVATEACLDPRLYGLDLAAKPVFRPEHDWYSFAVLLFRSLLLAHPYGGTHQKVKKLTDRAGQGLFVLASEITYPKIALTPWLLSDELLEVFQGIFTGQKREIFPLAVLGSFVQGLQECTTCREWFPASRRTCPLCQPPTSFCFTSPVQVPGLQAGEWLAAGGEIVASYTTGDKIYLLARVGDRAVVYLVKGKGQHTRAELFRWLPGASYAFMEDALVVNPAGSGELLLLRLENTGRVTPLLRTTTGHFEGRAVFAATARYLYRLAGGMLMQGELQDGHLLERPLSAVLEDQTCFEAFREGAGEFVAGFSRVFKNYEWFCLDKAGRSALRVTPLEPDETLLGYSFKPGRPERLLIRQTRQAGLDYLRLDVFSNEGKMLLAKRLPAGETDSFESREKGLFQAGVLVWPGGKGLLKENLSQGKRAEIAADPYLNAATHLLAHRDGLLAVTGNRLWKLTLS